MPIVINEIEVLEKPQSAPPGPEPSAAAQPATAALGAAVVRLLADVSSRQRRLVAD